MHAVPVTDLSAVVAVSPLSRRYRHDAALRRHFAKAHFLCDQGECKHKPPDYAAFRDAISLRAHQLAAHVERGSLSQAQLRQMARVDLNVGFFDSRLPDARGSGGSDTGRGRGRRGEEEYKGSREVPSYVVDDEDGGEEEYPVLQPSATSAIEQRARLANENIGERSKQEKREQQRGGPGSAANHAPSSSSSSSSSVSMQRSYSQPYGLAGRKFDTADFPTLTPTSTSNPSPTVVSPALPPSRPTIPPAPSDFPSLKQTMKSNTKLRALKDKASLHDVPSPTPLHPTALHPSYGAATGRAAPPPRSASTSPVPPPALPASSPPIYIDPRTVTHVPLPLPSPPPSDEAPARNRALIASIRSSLSSDEFDRFRLQSSAYRAGDLTASAYLDFFYHLMGYQQRSGEVERLLVELIALLPDEDKRRELHTAYATQMVWQKIAKMKSSGGPSQARDAAGGKSKVKATIVSNRGPVRRCSRCRSRGSACGRCAARRRMRRGRGRRGRRWRGS